MKNSKTYEFHWDIVKYLDSVDKFQEYMNTGQIKNQTSTTEYLLENLDFSQTYIKGTQTS